MLSTAASDSFNSRWADNAYWKNYASIFSAILAAVALINFLVNPFNIYGINIVPKNDLNISKNKLKLFNSLPNPPEALLIGSSRVMSYNPDIITEMTGYSAFNFSVAGCKTENIYAVLRYVLEKNPGFLKLVVISVDPQSFHPNLPIEPESLYVDEFSKYYKYDTKVIPGLLEKLFLLITQEQFEESYSTLVRLAAKAVDFEKLSFDSNGQAHWVQYEKMIEEGSFNPETKMNERIRRFPERVLGLSSYQWLSSNRKKYWTESLHLCNLNDIKIICIYPPAHPDLYPTLNSLGAKPLLDKISDYLKETVESSKGEYFDLRDFSLDTNGEIVFYDEQHPRSNLGDAVLRKVLKNTR